MIAAVDIGNTRVKVGIFQGDALVWVVAAPADALADALQAAPDWKDMRGQLQYLGLSSVGKEAMAETVLRAIHPSPSTRVIHLTTDSPMPIQNGYGTPKTLGMDRLCVAVAAHQANGGGPVLAVDAGTALKFEFVDGEGKYIGGSIGPGMEMRYRALNAFTAKLPKVDFKDEAALIGTNTETSIRSGVQNGFIQEVEGMINAYRERFGAGLPVYLTGGDAEFLRNHLKNPNFADAYLLLRGIHILIKQHV